QGGAGGLQIPQGRHPDGDRAAYAGTLLAGPGRSLYPGAPADRRRRREDHDAMRNGMSDDRIKPIVMPKWGLSMREGKVTGWLVEDGTKINPGDQILEVETDKIAGAVEATDGGVLRRRVGLPDTVYPVKALIGVIADQAVSDTEI